MTQYYSHYIHLVADVELSAAFDESIRHLDEVDRDLLTRLDNRKYAPNKWTVKEIIQHVTDFERIPATEPFFLRAENQRRHKISTRCSRSCIEQYRRS